MRKTRWLLGLLFAVLAYAAVVYSLVVHQAATDESRHADVIVVFGAAEYDGRPSPVYRARLDHASELFRRGLAPLIITTGGAGADPRYSEGEVGRDYLKSLGIPDRALIAETQSPDTAASAHRVANIMYVNSMHSCLAVSDAYHIFRIKHMMGREGVKEVYGAPRSNSVPQTFLKRQESIWHEIGSYTLWVVHIS